MDGELGQLVLTRRKALGLTQEDVARSLSISSSYAAKIENAERMPSRAICLRIARVLSLAEDDVLKAAGLLPKGRQMHLEDDEVELVRLYRKALPVAREATLAGLRVWARHAEEER